MIQGRVAYRYRYATPVQRHRNAQPEKSSQSTTRTIEEKDTLYDDAEPRALPVGDAKDL